MAEGNLTTLDQCLDRLAAGESSARDELIQRAADRLLAMTRKMLGDFERVRTFEQSGDIVQNVVMRLMKALDDVPVRSKSEFLGLAATLIRRELIDLSRHYYGPQGAGRHERPADPAGSTSPSGMMDQGEQSTFAPDRLAAWGEFHNQVEQLPSEEREVFDLLWYHQLSHPEAASLLGVSESTVQRRWTAAQLRLQKYAPVDPQR